MTMNVNLAIYCLILASNYHTDGALTARENIVFHGKFKRHSVTVRYCKVLQPNLPESRVQFLVFVSF